MRWRKEAKLVEEDVGEDVDVSWRNQEWGEDGMLVPPSISPDPERRKFDPSRGGWVKYFTNTPRCFKLGPAALCKARCLFYILLKQELLIQ